MLEKYPGVMVDPELMKEQDQQSKDLDKSMTLHTIPNEPPPEEKGRTVVMLGGRRSLAAQLASVMNTNDVVMVDNIKDPEYNMKSYPTIGAAALSMNHMATSPYAGKGKPRKTSFIEERRKEMRTSQKDCNKAQGYGQRITKKKPRKEPSNCEVKYIIEKEPVEHVIRVHATKTHGKTNIDSVEHKFF